MHYSLIAWSTALNAGVREIEIVKDLKKIFVNEKNVKVINALTRVRRIGYYSYIEREIGLKPYKLSSIISRLYENGIEFTAAIDYSKIGLDVLLIFIKKHIIKLNELPFLEWIRSYGLTKDVFGTYIQYYIPYEYRKVLVNNILKELKKKVDNKYIYYHYFDKIVRKQPRLTLNMGKHPLITGYSFNELMSMFNKFLNEKNSSENGTTEHSRPHDIIDLILLKEFEKKAFTIIYDLAKKLLLPARILNRHLNNHVLHYFLIKGIYMKTNIFVRYIGEPSIILVKAKNHDCYKALISLFENMENIFGIIYSAQPYPEINRDKYVIHAVMLETLNRKDNLYYFLLHLYNEGYIEKVKTMRFIMRTLKKFTVPYKNFLQEKKNWDLDTEKTHQLFERRFIHKPDI